MDYNY